ncbi:hypothetical protein COV18_00175 [Candidatus Woesearchaeota archaeon CG10_big_fil_rev_8_21_14_0_10_37_12]|nr:MAG: hypothetical protein COV18_00175 [Candidatus Woesearchaeota archaeon CG10_big_fil_rev_8_21_14_0_10_37_12]
MYIIKHVPEDFIVTELSTISPKEQGKYLYFKLWKKDYTTPEALRKIANALHVSEKKFAYAGLKDRRSVTEQVCSVFGASKQKIDSITVESIKISVFGFGDDPVHVGDLKGNKFTVVVRNLENIPEINSKFKNLFGEQRFSKNNAEVGKALVKRDFKKAIELIRVTDEQLINSVELFVQKGEFLTALRKLPRKRLLLYIHAYQSKLWNETAELSKEDLLPIVGFGSEVQDNATKKILEREQLTPRNFIINEFPELSVEGDVRKVWVEAKDVQLTVADDECFPGKKKATLHFFLPKGSYATEFIRQNF